MPNYILLERIELNASAASISFTNIPQSGYTDLKVVVSGRAVATSSYPNVRVRFNGDTSANYRWRRIYGDGSGATSDNSTSDTGALVGLIAGSNETANTFSNFEFYVPNYLGSNQKSISADAVSENNATTSYSYLIAPLWTGTAAINSINLYSSYNFAQYSTFSLYGLAAVGTTPVIAPKASGGNITTDGTYWIHTFNTTGSFVPNQTLSCDYLVVAGGGAGVGNAGGGGGAGGMRCTVGGTGGSGSLESPILVASGTTYTVTIGAGGAGASSSNNLRGANGSNSVFASITSTGGGGGGNRLAGSPTGNGAVGGSGGGAAVDGYTGGAGTSGQGFAGGASPGSQNPAGGGGGASAVGQDGGSANPSGGDGGAGRATNISGTSTTYAGGGGGSTNGAGTGEGGVGGGGSGGANNVGGTAGTVNTGGGGGAGTGGAGTGPNGGSGGSGVVIIRYSIA